MILSWFENYTKEDLPPEHIWEDADGLDEWWDRVKERRERGMSAPSGAPSGDADEELAENELARAFKE